MCHQWEDGAYNINVKVIQNQKKGMANMIILNDKCSAVWLPQDECFQVIEAFEGILYTYYMDKEEVENTFNVTL